MDVPGKSEDPHVGTELEQSAEEFCQPCGCDGKEFAAEGFCQTCGDYLCAECLKVHTIPRPMRKHVLLDKANMPRSAQENKKLKSTCTIICPDHHDKVIEFFCPAHNDILCGVCAVIKHKQCDTVYIPDVAEEYKGSKQFNNLIDTLNHLETDIKTLSSNIKETISSSRETSAKAVHEIQQFRKELNDYLDKKEQELILAAKRMEQEDTKLLQDLVDELDSLKNENSSFLMQLKSVNTEISNLFVTSKQMIKKVQLVLERFAKCAEKSENTSYTFERGQALKKVLVLNADFGEIKKTYHIKSVDYGCKNFKQRESTNIDFISKEVRKGSDIKVKTDAETNTPRITGMVLLSPHILLLADYNNKSLKTVDTASNDILSRLSLSGQPWDVTLLPQDQAAVTLFSEKKIQIISTEDRLSTVRYLNVKGMCFGISATMDNLIVSFHNPLKLDLMDFHGNVIVSVRRGSSEQALFDLPRYNTIVTENKVPIIHLSDSNKNFVTKLSVGGQVLSTYTNEKWGGLEGMTATGDGQLLVCNGCNQTVEVISEGGKVVQTLLDSTQGIQGPESICYCAEQNMLYVSSDVDGTVQTYRFT